MKEREAEIITDNKGRETEQLTENNEPRKNEEKKDRSGKGKRGYLDSQHRSSLIKFLIYAAITFILGLCTWVIFPQYGMVFLVLAVVSAIPTAMAAVNMVMFFRFRSVSEEDHERIEGCRGRILVFYDGVLTTTEKSFYTPCIAVINKNVMVWSDLDAKDEKALIRHLSLMAKKNGFKDWHIKVFKNRDEFVKRLNYLNEKDIKVLRTDEDMMALISRLSL